MSKYKTATKVLVTVLGAVYSWCMFTNAGQALVHQYPVLTGVLSFVALALAAFHVPVKKGTVTAIAFALMLFSAPLMAQTSAPKPAATVAQATSAPPPVATQSTVNFQIGAGALGLGMASQATPATDIKLELNPGFAKAKGLSLVSDNVIAPGANLQFYGGGVSYDLPKIFPKTSALAPVEFYVRGTVGADRITPPTGPGQSHIAFLAGGGLAWNPSSSVRIQLVEVDDGHFPGAPWGANAPVVSGGLSILFGKQ